MTVLHAGERDVAEAGGGAVDFSAFEHQKENIQPQPRGRSASALALLYGPTSGSHLADSQQPSRPLAAAPALDGAAGLRLAAHLQAEHARYMAELAATDPHESDDPLDAHFRYVQWLLEVFPQAPGHPSVIRVIERPLREFRGHERYRNDARYLRLWLWYTGLITEGQEAVLQFLVANGIGDSLAALYEEYAKVLESRGRSQKADEVFRLGVARKAQPLARLERRYDEFQRRVMAQTRRDVDNGLLGSGQQPQQQQQQNTQQQQHPASDENHAPGRTMLGTKRSGGAARSAAANTLRPSQRGLPSSGGPASTRPNARISVYADPSGRSDTSARPGDAAWPDIGTHDTRRKENVPAASAWRGQTLAQRPGGTLQPTQKFTVYSDHGDRQAGGASEGARQVGQPGVLSQRSDSAADASSLLLSLDASGAPLPPSQQQQQQQLKTTREKPRERMVMPDVILFPAGDGRPQCAEEARARLPRYAYNPVTHHPPSRTPASRPVASILLDDDDGSGARAGRAKRKSLVSSPTINTRAAQQGMLGIWGGALGDSDSDSESLADAQHTGSPVRDDYQFTMGPVTPLVVPAAARPLVAARSAAPAADENDAPTAVLDSVRASRRRQLRQAGPTPLAARSHHVLRPLGSISEASSDEEEEDAAPRTASRVEPLFGTRTARSPEPLGRHFEAPTGRTPGFTRTGCSASGAEYSALSGFTGISTIGGPSAAHVADGQEGVGSPAHVAHTPMRKRLSLAARDLRTITPRFPKLMGAVSDAPTDDSDDSDASDGSEPCTENIGEFGGLDEQMGELQMQMQRRQQQQQQQQHQQHHQQQQQRQRAQPSMFSVFRDTE